MSARAGGPRGKMGSGVPGHSRDTDGAASSGSGQSSKRPGAASKKPGRPGGKRVGKPGAKALTRPKPAAGAQPGVRADGRPAAPKARAKKKASARAGSKPGAPGLEPRGARGHDDAPSAGVPALGPAARRVERYKREARAARREAPARIEAAAHDPDDLCETCQRPSALCVCELLTARSTKIEVVVLQHPQEQDGPLGTVPLLQAALAHARVRVGLSWRNLADARGAEATNRRPWAVLYPGSMPAALKLRPPTAAHRRAHGAYLADARGKLLQPWPTVGGIVVLDGTWSQAKALWWRNPWLLKLLRLGFTELPPSIYGRLRRAPRPGYVSTLEATAAALDALREPPELGDEMRRAFRTMVQRLRDAN